MESRSGTRSDQRDAHPAAGAGKSGGHESGTLLVRRHDQRHRRSMFLVIAKYRIVDRQDGAAAIAENRVDTLVGQHLHQHVGARHTDARERVRGLI
jgi:hypothetical protein